MSQSGAESSTERKPPTDKTGDDGSSSNNSSSNSNSNKDKERDNDEKTSGRQRVLTGVKPTGVPHIGNYLGAIRPALELTRQHEAYLFIADLHALTIQPDPEDLLEKTFSVAATWLAFGLDPKRTVFYLQSDVPEISELAWILSCVTPTGLLNRAHSFKDAKAKDLSEDEINVGLYAYPILMAADILLFDTDVVPVGKDQKQHLEIAQEAARKFNLRYGETLKIPAPLIDESVMTIPGTDGRKMSKSYGNSIDLFVSDKQLQKTVKGIKTDSTPYGQPLPIEGDTVFNIYQLLASPEATANLEAQYRTGRKAPQGGQASDNLFGWGDAKNALYELLVEQFRETRLEYARLMNDRAEIRRLLDEGARKARETAGQVLTRVKQAVGIRTLGTPGTPGTRGQLF